MEFRSQCPDNSLEDTYPELKRVLLILQVKTQKKFGRYRDTDKTQSALYLSGDRKPLQALIQKAQEKERMRICKTSMSIKSYTVTNMGNDIFMKLGLTASGTASLIQTVPGEGKQGKNFDEYQVDKDALSDLIISMFYENSINRVRRQPVWNKLYGGK